VSRLPWDWGFAWSILPQLLEGLRLTLLATCLGSATAFALGLVWTFLRLKKIPVVTPVIEFLVQFVRGTPFLIQLYCLFYVLPTWGLSLSTLATGVLGLGLFYSAYATEVYRAGIEDLPIGQWEAALTLSLPLRRIWFGIVLPQAIRSVLPMLGNLVIAMFKESALLSTITVMELLAQGTNIGSIDFRFVEPLTLVGGIYFVVSYTAAKMLRALEASHAVLE
jgi:polar amino acid transport system permease protein